MNKSVVFLWVLIWSYCGVWAQTKHTVQAKETLYSLSQKYQISIEDIKKANPSIDQSGLGIGQVIVIPKQTSKEVVSDKGKLNDAIIVSPKQTLYSIGKDYNVSQEDLKLWNPKLTNGLKIGDTVYLKDVRSTVINKPIKIQLTQPHTVAPKETLYRLCKDYDLTQDEFYLLNPQVKENGLKIGNIIQIPADRIKVVEVNEEDSVKDNANPVESNKEMVEPIQVKKHKIEKPTDGLNVVLMLPFGGPSKNHTYATDFYNGAKLALKLLAKNGNRVNLKVINTHNSIDSVRLITQRMDWSPIHAILGPLHTDELISLSEHLTDKTIPILSPVSNKSELFDVNNMFLANPLDGASFDKLLSIVQSKYKNQTIEIIANDQQQVQAIELSEQLNKALSPKKNIQIKSVPDLKGNTQSTIHVVILNQDQEVAKYLSVVKAHSLNYLEVYLVDYFPTLDKQTTFPHPLTFVATTYVNYKGKFEKSVLYQMKDDFCANPPSKAMQVGYDTTYDFISRLDYNAQVEVLKPSKAFGSWFQYAPLVDHSAIVNQGVGVMTLKELFSK